MRVEQYISTYKMYIILGFLIIFLIVGPIIYSQGKDNYYGYSIKGTQYGAELPILGDAITENIIDNKNILKYYKENLLRDVKEVFKNEKYLSILYYYILEKISLKITDFSYITGFLTPIILTLFLFGFKKEYYIQFLASSTRTEYLIRIIISYILAIGISIFPMFSLLISSFGLYQDTISVIISYITILLIYLLYNSIYLSIYVIYKNPYYSLIFQYIINIIIIASPDISKKYSLFLSNVFLSFTSNNYIILTRNSLVYLVFFSLIIFILHRVALRVDIK